MLKVLGLVVTFVRINRNIFRGTPVRSYYYRRCPTFWACEIYHLTTEWFAIFYKRSFVIGIGHNISTITYIDGLRTPKCGCNLFFHTHILYNQVKIGLVIYKYQNLLRHFWYIRKYNHSCHITPIFPVPAYMVV